MSETRIIRNYYDEEKTKLKEEYFEMNGKKEGTYKGYDKSGCLAVQTNYVAGQRDGQSRRYYPPTHSNIMMEIMNYKNGAMNGEAKFYNEKGQLVRIANYINNKFTGDLLEYYHHNGQLHVHSTYSAAGKLNGPVKYYYDNGQLMKVCNYVNDFADGEYRFYYPNGNLKYECMYVNGKIEGELKRYHDDGRLYEYNPYMNGMILK